MTVDVFMTPAQVDPAVVAGRTCVVIDVIRATTTMVQALAVGADSIYPTVSSEAALKLAASLGRDATLLCGEREGLKVEGFDLGNSPSEYTSDTVGGKRLVMSTTNGTSAFLAASDGGAVYACAFLNLSAVARRVAQAENLVVVCAGKEDRFSLDDAVCAGHLMRRMQEVGRTLGALNDSAMAVLRLAHSFDQVDEAFLRSTAAGEALVSIGLAADLPDCARVDAYALVPEMVDRVIRA